MPRVLVLSLLFFGACATWNSTGSDDRDGGATDGGGASTDGATDPEGGGAKSDAATSTKDSGTKSDAAASTDAGSSDAGAASDGGSTADTGTGIDPDVALPSPAGAACSTPGSENGCPLASVCRIASASGGRCESCTNCGHLNDLCTASDECDIVFQCFRGHCTNFCHLGTYECGPITSCINVGHPTIGMCLP